MIKGRQSTIEAFAGITAKEINIGGYYEDSEIPVEFDLPEGVTLADGQEDVMLVSLKVTEKKAKDKKDN